MCRCRGTRTVRLYQRSRPASEGLLAVAILPCAPPSALSASTAERAAIDPPTSTLAARARRPRRRYPRTPPTPARAPPLRRIGLAPDGRGCIPPAEGGFERHTENPHEQERTCEKMCTITKSTHEHRSGPLIAKTLALCASARSASGRFKEISPVSRPHREGQRRVELTRSPRGRRTTGICAFRPFPRGRPCGPAAILAPASH